MKILRALTAFGAIIAGSLITWGVFGTPVRQPTNMELVGLILIIWGITLAFMGNDND